MINQHYITRKRTKINGIGGAINLPYGTEVDVVNDFLVYHGKCICFVTSQNAYDYFSCNDDGNGLLRGKLVANILNALIRHGEEDTNYQARWDKVWDDELCQKYKRKEHEDHWLWNHDFYHAEVDDLRYIAKLVGAKEVA